MTVYAQPGQAGAVAEYKSRYDHWIGGQYVAPVKGQYFENVTPVTGKVFCEVARGTERLQQRYRIEMTLDVASRRHRYRNGAQQHGHETRQTQKATGAIDGGLDLRARLTHVSQPLATLTLAIEPGLEFSNRLALAGKEQRVTRARARLQQLRRG